MDDDIINQYIIFCKVFNEQTKKHGFTRQEITGTIRICKNRDILGVYLESKEKEAMKIIMSLFDKEEIMKMYIRDECYEETKQIVHRLLKSDKINRDELSDCFLI